VLLAAPAEGQLTAEDLRGYLQAMAGWRGTAAVSLLLAPDAQRTGHPSVNLEPERRPIRELNDGVGLPAALRGARAGELRAGAFVVWQR
jgi:3,4-dihydroxy 2-butanone 4-phosphate synthase/GTP cyclohydrolase II